MSDKLDGVPVYKTVLYHFDKDGNFEAAATFTRYYGASTETKPSAGLNDGDEYIETDTTKRYEWNGSSWTFISQSTGGAGHVTLATKISGEDQTNDVLKTEQQFSFSNIVSATTTVVKSGAGLLHSINVNKAVAAATITIYDNTAASGTKIGTITFGAALLTDPPLLGLYDVTFATGLTIVTSGATDITVSWR